MAKSEKKKEKKVLVPVPKDLNEAGEFMRRIYSAQAHIDWLKTDMGAERLKIGAEKLKMRQNLMKNLLS
ncbi:MAG: hypothetical protein HY764_04240 [Candidatus Portnoybacteria bacterium]|nr:hypothetical protein [Candidatus Portnoybacteria bacterium]